MFISGYRNAEMCSLCGEINAERTISEQKNVEKSLISGQTLELNVSISLLQSVGNYFK